MNSITDLLDLEDSDVIVSDISIEGQTKTITLETLPTARFCPSCGFRMYSRGVKKRTINHPVFQDGYSLILVLKQRRWRCTNTDCLYDISELYDNDTIYRRASAEARLHPLLHPLFNHG